MNSVVPEFRLAILLTFVALFPPFGYEKLGGAGCEDCERDGQIRILPRAVFKLFPGQEVDFTADLKGGQAGRWNLSFPGTPPEDIMVTLDTSAEANLVNGHIDASKLKPPEPAEKKLPWFWDITAEWDVDIVIGIAVLFDKTKLKVSPRFPELGLIDSITPLTAISRNTTFGVALFGDGTEGCEFSPDLPTVPDKELAGGIEIAAQVAQVEEGQILIVEVTLKDAGFNVLEQRPRFATVPVEVKALCGGVELPPGTVAVPSIIL